MKHGETDSIARIKNKLIIDGPLDIIGQCAVQGHNVFTSVKNSWINRTQQEVRAKKVSMPSITSKHGDRREQTK